MSNQVDPDSFGFLITDLSRLLRAEMDRRIVESGIGLTPGEARALVHAARAGCVRQNALAERMGVEAMTLSGYLDRLEARGLITRGADPADRRAKLVRLTQEADAVLAATAAIAAGVRKKAAGSLGEEEWTRLREMLKTVRENLVDSRQGRNGARAREGSTA